MATVSSTSRSVKAPVTYLTRIIINGQLTMTHIYAFANEVISVSKYLKSYIRVKYELAKVDWIVAELYLTYV